MYHTSLNWKTYESITKYIYETLGRESNVQVLGYGAKCNVTGRSGVKHQIDVLTVNFATNFYTAIECKYWNKKINKDTVMKLSVIINDAGIHEGIIVSKKGFTKDAENIANHYGIKLVQLREFDEKDEEVQSKKIDLFELEQYIKIEIKRPKIIKITASTFSDEEIDLTELNQYATYIESDNQKLRLFDWETTFCKFLNEKECYREIIKTYDLNNTFCISKENKISIKSLSFTGLLTVINETKNNLFLVQDNVWLIMKKLFENKRFFISESGMIIEK